MGLGTGPEGRHALGTEKSVRTSLQWWRPLRLGRPGSVQGSGQCLRRIASAPVPQCDLYDGVAIGEGRLCSFLVIGGDGRRGVVFSALDDVESPDVEAGAREFAGKVGQGTGLVQQLHQYSFVRDCFEAGLVEDRKGVVRPVVTQFEMGYQRIR